MFVTYQMNGNAVSFLADPHVEETHTRDACDSGSRNGRTGEGLHKQPRKLRTLFKTDIFSVELVSF